QLRRLPGRSRILVLKPQRSQPGENVSRRCLLLCTRQWSQLRVGLCPERRNDPVHNRLGIHQLNTLQFAGNLSRSPSQCQPSSARMPIDQRHLWAERRHQPTLHSTNPRTRRHSDNNNRHTTRNSHNDHLGVIDDSLQTTRPIQEGHEHNIRRTILRHNHTHGIQRHALGLHTIRRLQPRHNQHEPARPTSSLRKPSSSKCNLSDRRAPQYYREQSRRLVGEHRRNIHLEHEHHRPMQTNAVHLQSCPQLVTYFTNGNIPAGAVNFVIHVQGINVQGGNSYRITLATTRGREFNLYYPWRFSSLIINGGGGNFVTNIGPLAVYFDTKSFNYTSGTQTTSQSAF